VSQGSKTCTDSDTFSFGGKLINDSRAHTNPAVSGFDTLRSRAPAERSAPTTSAPRSSPRAVRHRPATS
jgi:hypothetical protein